MVTEYITSLAQSGKTGPLPMLLSFTRTAGGWTQVFMCTKDNHNHFRFGYHFSQNRTGQNVSVDSVVDVLTYEKLRKVLSDVG